MADLLDQLQSTLGSAYRVERELGGGGMSRVFLAVDTALGRSVVIKVLPHEAAAQGSIDRFKREIALGARLQHPHIVPLLTAGDSDGLPYFIMPFVEGESLRARLARHGELPVSDAIRMLREIAAALAYAHERGIVHRDIKPDNVLLSGGSAMVTDFGVAKALSALSEADHGQVTSIGVALGTPAYMSPEQATADPAIDHRADIYSLGVLSYELLTGQPPFVGRTPQNLLAAQVTESPEPITKRRSSIPPALGALVMRCLEKRPADRVQTAAEIVRALDAITTPSGGMAPTRSPDGTPATSRRRMATGVVATIVVAIVVVAVVARLTAGRDAGAPQSIAVLPFDNRSGDTTYDYLAEGVSDQLRSDLTSLPGLAVKGSSSSRQFRGHAVNVHDAGTKLAAIALVTGTVNRSGDRLHVTAELVSVADDNALWSKTFDSRVADLSAIQDSLTRAITVALRLTLAAPQADVRRRSSALGTADFDAYDLYLRGRFAAGRGELARAIDLYTSAVAKDPKFARAYARLASVYSYQRFDGLRSSDSALANARKFIAKAVALDATLPEVSVAQASIQQADWKFAESDSTIATALAANPGSVDLHKWRRITLGTLGQAEASLAEARQTSALDPLDEDNTASLQWHLYIVRDYAAAIRQMKRILELDPSRTTTLLSYQALGLVYAFSGQPDSAVAAFEKALHLDSTRYGGRVLTVFGYAAAGRWKEASAQRLRLERDPAGNSPNYQRSIIHEVFGRMDSAMVDFERSSDAKEPLFLSDNTISCDPMFDPLKQDPRFATLMRRLGMRVCPASGRWPILPPPRGMH